MLHVLLNLSLAAVSAPVDAEMQKPSLLVQEQPQKKPIIRIPEEVKPLFKVAMTTPEEEKKSKRDNAKALSVIAALVMMMFLFMK